MEFISNLTIVSYIFFQAVFLSNRPLIGPALDMGVERLRNVYNINVTLHYVGSYSIETPLGMVDHTDLVLDFVYNEWKRNGQLALISTGQLEQIVLGQMAREWNTLLTATVASLDDFRKRDFYPTTFSTSPIQFGVLTDVFAGLFQHCSWSSIAVISDTATSAPLYLTVTSFLQSLLPKAAGQPSVRVLVVNTQTNLKDSFVRALMESSMYSRVLVLSMQLGFIRPFMLEAHRLGMTNGEFVFFAIELMHDVRFFGNLTWEDASDPSNDVVALDAFQSLLKVNPRGFKSSLHTEPVLAEMVDRSRRDYNFTYPTGGKPSDMVLAAYGALDILGQIINATVATGGNPLNGTDLIRLVLNRTFESETQTIFVDSNGERQSNYCISIFRQSTKAFEAAYFFDGPRNTLQPLTNQTIVWHGSAANWPPPNEPKCGYQGLNTICQPTGFAMTSVIAVAVCTCLLVSLAAIVAVRRTLHRSNVREERWWLLRTSDVLCRSVVYLSLGSSAKLSKHFFKSF